MDARRQVWQHLNPPAVSHDKEGQDFMSAVDTSKDEKNP